MLGIKLSDVDHAIAQCCAVLFFPLALRNSKLYETAVGAYGVVCCTEGLK